jgi:D-alanyl-D-alanine carboxypeptidase
VTHTKYYFENALIATTGILIIFFGFLVAGEVNNGGSKVASESPNSANIKTSEQTAPDLSLEIPAEPTETSKQAISSDVLVNKKNPLPPGYEPTNLRSVNLPKSSEAQMQAQAADALEELFRAAALTGVNLKIISAYRSYNDQEAIFNEYVAQYGASEAETFSARPGYSEHQTGLAVDVGSSDSICDLDECFGETIEGGWLAKNAHLFGFIVRYRENDVAITGYQYEPWHLRYLGNPLASNVYASDKSYEEYTGKQGGDYE